MGRKRKKRRPRRRRSHSHKGLISPQAKNYAIGNLLAGPGQWKNIYRTGAVLALALNTGFSLLLNWGALTSGSVGAAGPAIEAIFISVANSMMPLSAVVLQTPLQGIFTGLIYVATGLFYWTAKYEMNTPSRGI